MVPKRGAALALESQWQKDCELQASLGYKARLSETYPALRWAQLLEVAGFPMTFQLDCLREEEDGAKTFPFKHVLIGRLQLLWVTLWVAELWKDQKRPEWS